MLADLVSASLLGVEYVMVVGIVGLLVLAVWMEMADQAREAGERRRRPTSTPPLHVIRRRRPYDWGREGDA